MKWLSWKLILNDAIVVSLQTVLRVTYTAGDTSYWRSYWR